MRVTERREQLISVALGLFSHRPPDAVSIDEIAEAAGISRPLIYHYFPGKQSLYESALRRAADDLTARFAEPQGTFEGVLGERLAHVARRFFDFVEDHGPGFAALLRGGPAAGTSTATAIVDGVRQGAYRQLLALLDAQRPSPRLELLVRSWVSLAESSALVWLNGRRIPRPELESQLVRDFAALAAVAAEHDPELADLLARAVSREPDDGPLATLVERLRQTPSSLAERTARDEPTCLPPGAGPREPSPAPAT